MVTHANQYNIKRTDKNYVKTINGVSLDTPVVVSDMDEWTEPLLYEFDIDVRKYTESQNEIVLHIIIEPIEEQLWGVIV